jgi:cell division inhibitor SulA/protein ImuA
MSADCELARLLEHPAIWRGRSAAQAETLPTGYAALDACLPGKGWPRKGLIEILVSRFGVGELNLLLPTLAALTRRPAARWCVWISPPLEPYAPALAVHGVALERVLVVRAPESRPSDQRGSQWGLWAFEQTLGSGASDIALAWAARGPRTREIRRLQLAAERGKTLGVLFRPHRAIRESSPAILRVAVESRPDGVQLTFLKSRGGARGSIDLAMGEGRLRAPPAQDGGARDGTAGFGS